MDEEPNPIKDAVYEAINELGEESIAKAILQKNSSSMIKKILDLTQDKLGNIDDQKRSKMITILLHYVLALSMTPSQRKAEINGVEIDIIIPDSRTLRISPKDALIICIADGNDRPILDQLNDLKKIQSVSQNIWCITESTINAKRYSIQDDSLYNILDDIIKFLSNTKGTQFRFVKS